MNTTMMKKATFLTVATLFFLILGCNNGNKADKIIDIEKEFTFQLWEQLDEYGGNFQLLAYSSNCSHS